ncbi:hypothetical protein P171DRAFT_366862, partial [Karstenula rhodostoma CBS 690.94]
QAPKITANVAKVATIQAWFHKTGVAYSIKDLEKTLPQVASISGMQVKDYLQALQDDNKIRVEKIGSGNWYWSFPSDEKKAREAALERAQEDLNKADAAATELQMQVNDAGAARGEDGETLAHAGMDRDSLTTKHASLTKELEQLRQELAAYSEQDPIEVDMKKHEAQQYQAEVDKYTDQILSMECWLKERLSGDAEQMMQTKRLLYGDEFDEEEGGLREVHVESSVPITVFGPRASCQPPQDQLRCDPRATHRTHQLTVAASCTQKTPRMDSTSANLSAPGGTPAGPNTASPARGSGRARGRGRGFHLGVSEQNHEHTGGRGRGRGGNQAGRGRGHADRDGGANRGGRSLDKGKAPDKQGVPAAPMRTVVLGSDADADADADVDEGEVCFICASPVQHTAVAPCNHRSCHICSLRLRALYKTKACAHCRTESDHVIFTDDSNGNFQAFAPADFFKSDDNLGIHFENLETYDDTRLLLQYNCPDSDCDVACLGWPDLHRHVKTAHGKVMCDLCTRNKKVFTHEHELFTFAELRKHQKFGDDNPGAIDQSGFKGHPECGFCRQRFYGDDELYTHCREKHERCHLCDRRNEGRKPQYYLDYDDLENHFRKDHFVCPDRECLEKKFVVFDSEMDLKAHQLESHPNGLSKDALRDARRVDMSGFSLRTHQQEQDGRRGRAGRDERGDRGGRAGRGRDPNSEPLPSSSAQPMTRAELAYQRQMALQNASSTSGTPFGGSPSAGPTPMEAFAARPRPSASDPPTVSVARPTRASADEVSNRIGQIHLDAPAPNVMPQTPQEQARLLRHSAVTERASNMLRNDQTKLQEFRSSISAFRSSGITATQLIEGFFALFDTSSAELGKLVKELADIFEIQRKREALLKAWSDWKAINEDYPSLPGSATGQSLNGGPSAHGGSRVLKLKSSTVQSSRSAVNRHASWNNAASSSTFPALPTTSSNRIGAKPGQTPWAASSASPRVSPMPSRATSSVALNKSSLADAFPALPAAPKPTSTFFSPGYTGAGVRRDNSGRSTPANAWGAAGGMGSSSTAAAAAAAAGEDAGGGKKKGSKNKKQTLFHFG